MTLGGGWGGTIGGGMDLWCKTVFPGCYDNSFYLRIVFNMYGVCVDGF